MYPTCTTVAILLARAAPVLRFVPSARAGAVGEPGVVWDILWSERAGGTPVALRVWVG